MQQDLALKQGFYRAHNCRCTTNNQNAKWTKILHSWKQNAVIHK